MNGLGKSYRFMRINPETEGVTCIQLFGNVPEDFTEAMKLICEDELLRRVDIFDINMGCPVQKVVKTGAGSGLMRTPELASKIVKQSRATAESLGKVLTVKTRIGFNDNTKNGPEFAKMLADSGAQAICVHGRTATQMYAGKADWEVIRDVKRSVSIPVFGNGDVRSGADALRMMEQTGCDAVIVGRAAQGNPWLFREIAAALRGQTAPPPTPGERVDMAVRHFELERQLFGEKLAVLQMRKHITWYVHGMPGASRFRERVNQLNSAAEVIAALREYAEGVQELE